jgi:hypothetical protein
MKRDGNAVEKKPYMKPVVTRYPLRPEEAVLGFCKSSASAGSNGGTCTQVGNCFAPGS